ncbi:MAG: hypothetical protein V3S97_05730 [Candidatus Bathyarchaeia archaeon]
MSEDQLIDMEDEREDVYRKFKDGFNVLASIMYDEKTKPALRIRAMRDLSKTAKTLRLFLLDVEKYGELEKKIDGLIKQYGKRIG